LTLILEKAALTSGFFKAILDIISSQSHMENKPEDQKLIEQASMLIQRLERISADSIWARRSSGLRGALLKIVDANRFSQQPKLTPDKRQELEMLIETGFWMLEKAAQERLR
jgi:hypothetical protein